ncbi:uncharacterized protein F5891DRAFT_984657 [Suillus fuscotomentosus]|uniref:Uncharacterized protein n=1 Tax=Suillus fuscotomentosus TaxID=1912939 RepID=A0AAD4DY06_9AGAM|nr:uncharacterized protein F5891DRAFT_984657 [Suillus fuscotomentosus]KAG1894964.1 hypothetical protein F5891DRAFT_984657 [Suillus fuscotomentosus]
MSQPATCPGNANKHPGQVVLDANRVLRPKGVVAAERNKKAAEKLSKAAALKDAQKQIAAKEDEMAVEQLIQEHLLFGTAIGAKNSATQYTDIQKKKHPGLKLAFKDGVNTSRKVSNSGVIAVSVTHVGNTDDGKISKSMSESLSSIPSERMTDDQGNLEMSVSVVETANSNKPIKTEAGQLPWAHNIKKEKLKNAHLPIGAQNSEWRSKFIPTVMYWIGNSNFSWTIPDNTLSNLLHNIYYSVYKQLGDFEVDGSNGTFNVVCQRISKWRRNFGSTAITILMVFFASTNEYETPETQKAYSEYQIEDSCFVYEDPDSEDSPGAFLSEFILHIFAAHLNAIQGHQLIDTLNVGLPGYQTALALTTATSKCALILVHDNLIIEDTSDHGKHKIVLTLNQATNKMSNTGTTFSAGNWETDMLAYMEWIEELPFNRMKEIMERSQPYMKCPCHKSQDKDTVINSESHIPVNP